MVEKIFKSLVIYEKYLANKDGVEEEKKEE